MNGPAIAPKRQLDLGFIRHGDRTVLGRKLFSWPFVLTRSFALDAKPAHMQSVILQTGAGAIHGEDRLLMRLAVEPEAAAHVTTQGATSIHRANHGDGAMERLDIVVGRGGYLEYLPEARILFPDAALESAIDIEVEGGGTALVADAFTLHDPTGQGRMFRRLSATTCLRRPGEQPFAVERFTIGGPTSPLAGHRAFGSLYLVTDEFAEVLTSLAADLNSGFADIPGLYAAASLLQDANGIGIRFAAMELRDLRRGVDLCWKSIRVRLFGALPGARPG